MCLRPARTDSEGGVDIDMKNPNEHALDGARRNQLLWFTGALGTTIGVAVWAYSRREIGYWEKTKRTASQVAGSAAEINPWVGIGAGTAALGSAALAYRLRRPRNPWQKAGERAEELLSQTGKQLRPWLGAVGTAALGAASLTYNAKARKRLTAAAADESVQAADRFGQAASRLWRRLQTISAESGQLVTRARHLVS
jgi:hypothetical protein